MFLIHRTSNDKTLSVPVAQQLYGLLAYATSQGEFLFENGSRSLSDAIGVAPMIVGEIDASLHAVPFRPAVGARDRGSLRLIHAQRLGARIQERQKERH